MNRSPDGASALPRQVFAPDKTGSSTPYHPATLHGFRKFLLFLFVCLVPFQDTILQKTPLQGSGASFAILPLLGLMGISLFEWLMRMDFRLQKNVFWIALYVALISIFGMARFGLVSHGTSLLWSGTKYAIDTAIALYIIFGVDYSDERILRRAISLAFFFTVASIVISDLNPAGIGIVLNNPLMHQTPPGDLRWRGATTESGHLAILLVSVGLLAAHLSKTPFMRKFFWILTVTLTVAGGSKGGLLCLFGVLMVVLLKGKISFWRSVLFCIAFSPLAYLAMVIFIAQTSRSLGGDFTSFPTRITTVISAILIVLHYPFGVGFTGQLPALREYLEPAMDITQRLMPFPPNFSEVETYLYTAQFAQTKILLADYAVFFGFPFLILVLVECYKMVRALARLEHLALMACVLFLILALSTYSDSIFAYNVFIAFGVGVHEYKKILRSQTAPQVLVAA